MVDPHTEPDELGPSEDAPVDAPGDDAAPALPRKYLVAAQVGLVVLAVLVVGVVLIAKGGDDGNSTAKPGGGGGAGEVTTKAAKPAWPAAMTGRPPALGKNGQTASEITASATAKPGIYVWGDFDGMHLWVVKGGGVPLVSGTIESNDEMQKAVSAIEGAGDVTIEGKRASFRLPGEAPIEGVDFNPGFYGSKVVILLNGPDGPIDPALVHFGKKAVQAPYPLVIEKVVP